MDLIEELENSAVADGCLFFFKKERLDFGPYGDTDSPVKKEVTEMLLQSAYACSSDEVWGFILSGGVDAPVTTSEGMPLNPSSLAARLLVLYAAAAPKTRNAPIAAPMEIIEVDFSWELFSLIVMDSIVASASLESFAPSVVSAMPTTKVIVDLSQRTGSTRVHNEYSSTSVPLNPEFGL